MTVSDHLGRDEHLSADERQLTLDDMLTIGFETAATVAKSAE
jgi:purine-nucleoside phosphorylase